MAAPTNSKSDVKCFYCGKSHRIMKRCTRCKSSVYCSRDCQIQDWHKHKSLCSRDTSSYLTTAKSTSVVSIGNSAMVPSAETGIKSTCSQPEQLQTVKDTDMEEISSQGEAVVQPDLSTDLECTKASQEPVCRIIVKCQRNKHAIQINVEWKASEMLAYIGEQIRIPREKLKLVHKGKLVDEKNVRDCVKSKAVFQAIGEVAESEEGLDSSHVDCVVSKLGVERNEAVRALRLVKGDVIDAILYLGNK